MKFFISKDGKEFSTGKKAKPDFIELKEYPLTGSESSVQAKRCHMKEIMERFVNAKYEYNATILENIIPHYEGYVVAKRKNYYRIIELGGLENAKS